MAITNIPNETGNVITVYGTEIIPGTAVTPTAQLRGQFMSTENRATRQTEEATGGYDRGVNLTNERSTFAANYTEETSFDSLAGLGRYAIVGGDPAVGDSETTEAFTRVQAPSFDSDDIDSGTFQYGVDGKGFQSTGFRFDEFNISCDHTGTDNVWMLNGTGFLRGRTPLPGSFDGIATGGSTSTAVMTGATWTIDEWIGAYYFQDFGTHIGEVRRVASNTADTLTLSAPVLSGAVAAADVFHIAGMFPVIAVPTSEKIVGEGTKIYLDVYNSSSSSAGSTDISERVLSWNVTQTLGISAKYRAPGQIARVGRGARWITGTIRLEDDRWDEYYEWKNNTRITIRIAQTGSAIDTGAGTFRSAQIDVEKAKFNVITPDTDNNNLTKSITFVSELVPGDPTWELTTVSALAALP